MNKQERESKFDKLIRISKRIITAKESLFVGIPYQSKMKPGKENTYERLNRMQNDNIEEVSIYFF